jgi:hypothetical protein
MLLLSAKMKYVTTTVVKLDTSKPENRRRMIKISEVHREDDDEGKAIEETQRCERHAPTVLNEHAVLNDDETDVASHVMSREESVRTKRLYEAYSLRPDDMTSVKIKVFGADAFYGKAKPEVDLFLRECCLASFVMHFTDDGELSAGEYGDQTSSRGRQRNTRIALLPDEFGNKRFYRQRDRPAVIQFWPIFSFLNNEEDASYSALVR